jgi:hypothetical protein
MTSVIGIAVQVGSSMENSDLKCEIAEIKELRRAS